MNQKYFPFFILILLYSVSSFDLQSQEIVQDSISSKKSHFETAKKVVVNSILTIPSDFGEMGNIVSEDWGTTAAYVGGMAGLILVDKPVTTFYQDHVETNIDYKLPRIHKNSEILFLQGNDAYLTYSIIGIYGGSLIGNYETGQRAAVNSVKALAYSYVVSHLFLKSVIGRQRPDPTLSDGIPAEYPYTNNPFDFGNFHGISLGSTSNGTAMPSFHATAYFSVAQVLAMEFNNYWIPYSAVSFLFLANIKSHHHWFSDMAIGGAIGVFIGKAVVRSSRKLDQKQKKSELGILEKNYFNYQLLPHISQDKVGLDLVIIF